MPQWVELGLSYVGGAASGAFIAWTWLRGRLTDAEQKFSKAIADSDRRFDAFIARYDQSQETWKEWRKETKEDLRRLQEKPVDNYQDLFKRMVRVEKEIGEAHNEGLRGAVHALETWRDSVQTWIDLHDRDPPR